MVTQGNFGWVGRIFAVAVLLFFSVAPVPMIGPVLGPVLVSNLGSDSAKAASKSDLPKLASLTPLNASEGTEPVSTIALSVKSPAALGSLKVVGPDGTEYVLLDAKQKRMINSKFEFALAEPVSQAGEYNVYYVLWSVDGRSSLSGVYSFRIISLDAPTVEEPDAKQSEENETDAADMEGADDVNNAEKP